MESILITGGTGLVGTHLSQVLQQQGYQVVIATRKNPTTLTTKSPQVSYIQWDPSRQYIDPSIFGTIDHIINLAGAGVADQRWTEKRKKEILQSRVDSGFTITKALQQLPNKVKTVVQASAIGWYGPDASPIVPFEENAPMDHHYLGTTCGAWESSVTEVKALSKRVVTFRIGIVLSKEGGALKEFLKPVKMGVAPVFASGSQMVSWIHIGDLCNMLVFAIQNEQLHGIYNAVAPHPVSQKTLIKALVKAVKPPIHILAPVPAFVLKLMLGEMSVEILKSATVSSRKIQEAGFLFSYEKIEDAFHTFFSTP